MNRHVNSIKGQVANVRNFLNTITFYDLHIPRSLSLACVAQLVYDIRVSFNYNVSNY